jgi:hypothetical protein
MQIRLFYALLSVILLAVVACVGTTPPSEPDTSQAVALVPPTSSLTATKTATPSPTSTTTHTATPTPEPLSSLDILTLISDIMEIVDSYHYVADGNITFDDGKTNLEMPFNMTVDFQAPDQFQAHLTMSFLFYYFEFEMISMGDVEYTTNPDTGERQLTISEVSPTPTGGPGALGDLLDDPDEFLDLTLVGTPEVDGFKVFHLEGEASSEFIRDLEAEGIIKFDLWVDATEFQTRRISMDIEMDFHLRDQAIYHATGEAKSCYLARQVEREDQSD